MERTDDLISRAAAIEAIGERPLSWTDTPEELQAIIDWDCYIAAIKSVPAVNAIPVVRCKDCVHFNTIGCGEGFGWCEGTIVNTGVTDTFFCAEGERKEEQNND